MIDTTRMISDSQLDAAYGEGMVSAPGEHRERLRRVSEFAIAVYINSTLPAALDRLEQVCRAVERHTGEVIT